MVVEVADCWGRRRTVTVASATSMARHGGRTQSYTEGTERADGGHVGEVVGEVGS